jgi:hypothetical protein
MNFSIGLGVTILSVRFEALLFHKLAVPINYCHDSHMRILFLQLSYAP